MEASQMPTLATVLDKNKTNWTNNNEPAVDYRLAEDPSKQSLGFCFCSFLFVQFVVVRYQIVDT